MNSNRKEHQIGIICAVISAIMWGFLPAYWKTLEPINPISIMFYRLVLAFIFVLIICIFMYGIKGIIEPLKQKRKAVTFFFAGLLISINWAVYIWAVNSENIVQASMGYYIEPLFVALAGVLLFHEKLNKFKITAVIFAVFAVSIMIFSYGKLPLLALLLALSFATYTAIKKHLQAPAILSLLYETGLMLPIAIPIIIFLEKTGRGAMMVADTNQLLWLSLAGIFTAAPLIFFGMSANRISIISLGLIEYIGPSLSLFLGIFIYKETFDIFRLIGFVVIWVGLAIFSIGEIKDSRNHALEN